MKTLSNLKKAMALIFALFLGFLPIFGITRAAGDTADLKNQKMLIKNFSDTILFEAKYPVTFTPTAGNESGRSYECAKRAAQIANDCGINSRICAIVFDDKETYYATSLLIGTKMFICDYCRIIEILRDLSFLGFPLYTDLELEQWRCMEIHEYEEKIQQITGKKIHHSVIL